MVDILNSGSLYTADTVFSRMKIYSKHNWIKYWAECENGLTKILDQWDSIANKELV